MVQPRSRVYRSRHQLIVCAVVGVVFWGIGFGMLFEVRRPVVPALLVGFLVIWPCISVRAALARVVPSREGVRVQNVFSTFEVGWAEVERFEMGRRGILPYVCVVHLRDGGRRSATGIQERTNFPDGSAEEMVAALNTERLESCAQT